MTHPPTHPRHIDRRTMLKRGSLGLLSLGLGGCATTPPDGIPTPAPLPVTGGVGPASLGLVPVEATWERVIRTTVGLRPYRPSGFVVRADRMDDKLIVHNYGHGGAGMSLSWGTASLAADLAVQYEVREAAVLGCGVAGLTTGLELQRRGFRVTIYAASVPPNTTSNKSLASWTPASGLVSGMGRTGPWEAQFRQAARIAYNQLQLLAGPRYGVSWIDSYALRNQPPREGRQRGGGNQLLPSDLQPGAVTLGPGEHPFPSNYVSRRPSLRIEPSIYLAALVDDFRRGGGAIVIRQFEDAREVAALTEGTVINCTGLGAGRLFGDEEIMPVKGQLTFLVPQPLVNYATFGGVPDSNAGSFVHMQPRQDGIALGGTTEEGVWDLEPNEQAIRRVVDAHVELFARMAG